MAAQGKRGKRKFNMKSLSYAVSGPEKKYPVYRWGNRRQKFERPNYSPFPAP